MVAGHRRRGSPLHRRDRSGPMVPTRFPPCCCAAVRVPTRIPAVLLMAVPSTLNCAPICDTALSGPANDETHGDGGLNVSQTLQDGCHLVVAFQACAR